MLYAISWPSRAGRSHGPDTPRPIGCMLPASLAKPRHFGHSLTHPQTPTPRSSAGIDSAASARIQAGRIADAAISGTHSVAVLVRSQITGLVRCHLTGWTRLTGRPAAYPQILATVR
jgi:hypothetical protein